MNRVILLVAFLFSGTILIGQNNVRLEIQSVPVFHTAEKFYAAGSFNSWNPGVHAYQFQKDDKGNYFVNLKLNTGTYEYKMTRGSWDKVECSSNGSAVDNRVMSIRSDTTIYITVTDWQDNFSKAGKTSSASKNVYIIDTAFWIPQLNRNRRVWIYLPKDYNEGKQKFPVLYMHDGQNVFEDSSSFSGEWGVDEFLDSSKLQQCIVVAIDNGANKRLNEYNPYDNERFGKGEGDAYVKFIVRTLKPLIDKHYQTQKSKTYIAGSSMGGLISMYAVMKYPKVFAGAGVFSPAFWTAPKIFDAIKKKAKKIRSNIFFFAGKQEGEQMVPDMLKAFQNLAGRSKAKMKIVIRDEGKHNEATWRKEFPSGYSWMLYGKEPDQH